MNPYNQMLKRANLQHIREFIHSGGETESIEIPYRERLDFGACNILKSLKTAFVKEEDYEQAEKELMFAFCTYADVYMEIGMKTGARLVMELLKDDSLHSIKNR